jgi:hypothetical protein
VGKLAQLLFAVVAPGDMVSNIVAGAVAEAGAQQAGDLLQVRPVKIPRPGLAG